MSNQSKLNLVKSVHTVVWIFFNVVIFYMLYAVIVDKIDHWLWIAYGLIVMEALVLLIFKFICPLTLIARKYSDSSTDNFDIFLPNWLARNTKRIYTTLVLIIIVATIYRILT